MTIISQTCPPQTNLLRNKFVINIVYSTILGITGGVQHSVINKSGRILSDDITTQLSNKSSKTQPANYNNSEEERKENTRKHKGSSSKPGKVSERTLTIAQEQTNGASRDDGSKEDAESLVVWSQRQQKVFEKALSIYPKGTEGRWDKIADTVPGKSKVSCV